MKTSPKHRYSETIAQDSRKKRVFNYHNDKGADDSNQFFKASPFPIKAEDTDERILSAGKDYFKDDNFSKNIEDFKCKSRIQRRGSKSTCGTINPPTMQNTKHSKSLKAVGQLPYYNSQKK